MEISYALLYDLVRKERASAELQELQASFYEDTQDFLSTLQKTADEERYTGSDAALLQLANTRKLVKELYDRREQKILLLAQNRARTNSALVDSPNLLARERALFERIIVILSEARTGVTTTTIERTQTRTITETVKIKETVETTPPIVPQEHTITTSEQVVQVVIEEPTVSIRITKRVPQFLGPDMETLGPFEEDEHVDVASSVAAVLIRKGSAEKSDL